MSEGRGILYSESSGFTKLQKGRHVDQIRLDRHDDAVEREIHRSVRNGFNHLERP